jgi:cytochrome c-type biogenesis protein CcmF
MAPIGLILLLLTGIAPLLAWRKTTLLNFRDEFFWPTLVTVAGTGALVALGVHVWSSGICFAFCIFVTASIVQEFWRGAVVRREGTGTDLFTALVGLVGRSKRRYGGYIVHLGIVLAFLGFAGDGFKREEQVLLPWTAIDRWPLHGAAQQRGRDRRRAEADDHRSRDAARGRQGSGPDVSGQWFYRHHEEEPTTEVAIRRGFRAGRLHRDACVRSRINRRATTS